MIALRWHLAWLGLLLLASLPVLVVAALGTVSVVWNGLSTYADDRTTQFGAVAIFLCMIASSIRAAMTWRKGRIEQTLALLTAHVLFFWMSFSALIWWAGMR